MECIWRLARLRPKRQRTGAVQKLAPSPTGHVIAKRPGLRHSSGAFGRRPRKSAKTARTPTGAHGMAALSNFIGPVSAESPQAKEALMSAVAQVGFAKAVSGGRDHVKNPLQNHSSPCWHTHCLEGPRDRMSISCCDDPLPGEARDRFHVLPTRREAGIEWTRPLPGPDGLDGDLRLTGNFSPS
jgi:hypothetical protein